MLHSFPAFSLRLPGHVRFGRGASLDAVPEIAAFADRILLVHGRTRERATPLIDALMSKGCAVTAIACPEEPDLAMLKAALGDARRAGCTAVVALGGGAALDLGKAVAALMPADADPMDHLEIVGFGRPLTAAPVPFIAIPTTAGTGSEATKNAVISVPDHGVKVSLRDDRMVPDLAIVDPALADGTPKSQTLASGMDAVVQVIEPYLSARATPFTDALTRPAIAPALEALVTLMETGEQPEARDALAYTAHVSGIALANAGLGAVHGLAGVLGGKTGAAHGVICARLLPAVLDALLQAETLPHVNRRIRDVHDLIDAHVPGGSAGLHDWMSQHGLAVLAPLAEAEIETVATAAQGASSMAASPVRFGRDALTEILRASLSRG